LGYSFLGYTGTINATPVISIFTYKLTLYTALVADSIYFCFILLLYYLAEFFKDCFAFFLDSASLSVFGSIYGNIVGMTAFLAVWLITALGVASVASPVSLPYIIITAWRTHAIFIDELMTTSAPTALVIAFIAQPEAEMLVQMNETFLG
tara:strand:- start:31 stop:480 length:450 start_codon:yes stop_codon:yes gene_type:complete